ncbi:hypothetical protein CKAH01_12439 [Colletotrichum kahawae]|uniref:Uncharacterized protein n=1 Tax=Colletotrichum kahawae TaxID=34407 RepID=A0AAD9YRJ3_COLKA|nr:hypothetical protein CKAH01_12439 [Colletotrichum kahawae]
MQPLVRQTRVVEPLNLPACRVEVDGGGEPLEDDTVGGRSAGDLNEDVQGCSRAVSLQKQGSGAHHPDTTKPARIVRPASSRLEVVLSGSSQTLMSERILSDGPPTCRRGRSAASSRTRAEESIPGRENETRWQSKTVAGRRTPSSSGCAKPGSLVEEEAGGRHPIAAHATGTGQAHCHCPAHLGRRGDSPMAPLHPETLRPCGRLNRRGALHDTGCGVELRARGRVETGPVFTELTEDRLAMESRCSSVQGCGLSLRFRHVKRLSVLGRDEASHGLSRVCSLTTVDMAIRLEGGSDLRVNSPVRCSAVQCSVPRQAKEARYMGQKSMHPAVVPRVKLRRQEWDVCGREVGMQRGDGDEAEEKRQDEWLSLLQRAVKGRRGKGKGGARSRSWSLE